MAEEGLGSRSIIGAILAILSASSAPWWWKYLSSEPQRDSVATDVGTVANAAAMIQSPATSSAPRPSRGVWIVDQRSGCRVWDYSPQPGETITWNGACSGGYAQGRGTLTWYLWGAVNEIDNATVSDGVETGHVTVKVYEKGELTETASGQFNEDGSLNGEGTLTYPNGAQYVGTLKDSIPNGHGKLTFVSGETYEGWWTNGCFKQGRRQMAAGSSMKDCGFEP